MISRMLLLLLAVGVVAGTQAPDELQTMVGQGEEAARQLGSKLATCRAQGRDTALPEAALAVGELFCRFARADADQDDLRPGALAAMRYVAQMLSATEQEADDVLAGKREWPRIPQWNTVGVTARAGGFWVGQEPVFLSGMNWDAGIAEKEPDLAHRLGINLVDSSLRGTMRPNGEWDLGEFNGRFGPYFERMEQAGFAVDALLGCNPPKWLVDATPGLARQGYGHYDNYVFEHPRAVAFREELLDQLIPLAARHRSLFAIDLTNEPAYQQPSEIMLANYRTWLERKYGTVAALNQAWGTELGSFAEVTSYPSAVPDSTNPWQRAKVDFTQPGVRGAHYDWCAFNNERVSAYFRSLADRIRAHAPDVAIHVKVMMGLYFAGSIEPRGWGMDLSYHTFGIDPEAIAEFADLLGCDLDLTDLGNKEKPNRFRGSTPYVIGWLNAGMSADFLKSLAPDKPFYNSEFHAVEAVDATDIQASAKDHIETALWLASLHGMGGNLLWFWGRGSDGKVMGQARTWFKGSLLQQPWVLQGYCQTSLDLRRFVAPVQAFAQQPRPVRLLYAEPSAIQDVAYLDCLRDAYEALNFLGVPIGFVTEKQLAQGLSDEVKLVIVPNAQYVTDATVAALAAARARGAAVKLIGPSLTLESTGGKRTLPVVLPEDQISLGTPQDYHPVFDRWLESAQVPRELRAVDANGHPAWGVEVRTARLGDQRLAYLVNENREPTTVRLHWAGDPRQLTDWRTDQTLAQEVTLQPRQVVFGAY